MAWVMSNYPGLCCISYGGVAANNRPVKSGTFYYVGIIPAGEGSITLSPRLTIFYANASNAHPPPAPFLVTEKSISRYPKTAVIK